MTLQLTVTTSGPFSDLTNAEYQSGRRAVKAAMVTAAASLKQAWRGEVVGAGLGTRLANSIQSEVYPEKGPSMRAAALVHTDADEILQAHDEGALISASGGIWLAIPLPVAGRGTSGGRMTPGVWMFTHGRMLRFVSLGAGRALLVADDARINKAGRAVRKKGKRRLDGILTGAQTVPIFTLRRKVKLSKRTDVVSLAQQVAGTLPGLIKANWR